MTSEEAAEAWSHAVSTQSQWDNVLQSGAEEVWSLFTKDLQNFQVFTGRITNPRQSFQLGMVPRLISGGHRVGFGQLRQERVLRRAIRRTREALMLDRSRIVPPGLVRNITKGLTERERVFARHRQWKPLETELLGKLECLLSGSNQSQKRSVAP